MRQFITTIILLLALIGNAYSQISIIPDKPQVKVQESFVYDSFTNFLPLKEQEGKGYRHLIGQTMLYVGDP